VREHFVKRLVAKFFRIAVDAGMFKRNRHSIDANVFTIDSECSFEWRSVNKEQAARPLYRGAFVKFSVLKILTRRARQEPIGLRQR